MFWRQLDASVERDTELMKGIGALAVAELHHDIVVRASELMAGTSAAITCKASSNRSAEIMSKLWHKMPLDLAPMSSENLATIVDAIATVVAATFSEMSQT